MAGESSLRLKTVLRGLAASIRNYLRPVERPDLLVSSPHEQDAHSEIEFVPIDPSSPHLDSDVNDFVCPVTRQIIDPLQGYYQCGQCGTAYSLEGWEFLKDMAEGECCACRTQNTIRFVKPPRGIV